MDKIVTPAVMDPSSDVWMEKTVSLALDSLVFATSDCRVLTDIVNEIHTHKAWDRYFKDEPKTWERFCAEALDGINPDFIERVKEGVAILEGRGHSGPIPSAMAERTSREVRQERNEKIIELREAGLTQAEIAGEVGVSQQHVSNTLQEKSQICEKTCKPQTDRAKENKISHYTQRKIDKIRKIDPALADRCEAKQVKVAQAERQVGLAPNRVDLLVKAFKKLSPVERAEFLKHINL